MQWTNAKLWNDLTCLPAQMFSSCPARHSALSPWQPSESWLRTASHYWHHHYSLASSECHSMLVNDFQTLSNAKTGWVRHYSVVCI